MVMAPLTVRLIAVSRQSLCSSVSPSIVHCRVDRRGATGAENEANGGKWRNSFPTRVWKASLVALRDQNVLATQAA